MTETHWGRKETIVWPPHTPIYTYGAVFLALIATGLFLYVRFAFALSPLQQYYLPVYLKASMTPSFRASAKYQILMVSDARGHVWYATGKDVVSGSTPQPGGKRLPLTLSASAKQNGIVSLYRSAPTMYQNSSLRSYLKQRIYGGAGLVEIFERPLFFGLLALLGQLPFSILKDIRRRKQMKYGRRLKGPILVTPKEFNKAFQGTGIGIKTDGCKEMLRIPIRAEDQHFEIIGDTGSGKTTIIMQMLRQIQARGHSAILYDPACEFIERFYDEKRGDIVLNPLDRRCPYWGPSEELVRRAEARTIAASLFQPTSDKKGEFFIESPQKIFAYGNIAAWINALNLGGQTQALAAYTSSVLQAQPYPASALAIQDADTQSVIQNQVGTSELAQGTTTGTLSTLGAIRSNSQALAQKLANLDADTYSTDPTQQSEMAVLGKINTATLLQIHSQQDTNQILAASVQQQLVPQKQQIDAQNRAINEAIYFEQNFPNTMQQITGGVSDSIHAISLSPNGH